MSIYTSSISIISKEDNLITQKYRIKTQLCQDGIIPISTANPGSFCKTATTLKKRRLLLIKI
jgi:hypothetical protein